MPNSFQQDPNIAFYFAEKAALKGHTESMELLADYHDRGFGTERNLAESRHWKKAHAVATKRKRADCEVM
jgi:TPR repeat protein